MAEKKKPSQSTLDIFLAKYPDHLKPIAMELVERYNFIEEIKKGKTGVTYRLDDNSPNSNVSYCLKTIRSDITDEEEKKRVKDSLAKEVTILSKLTHRCLPQVFGSNLKSNPPYYICTFHPGESFNSFHESRKKLDQDESIYIISSLIDVLDYLHKTGRSHCDLHLDNILISEKVFAEGILVIDFGSGHRESDDNPTTPIRGNAGFKQARELSQNRLPANRKILANDFKHNDFTAFGICLATMKDCFFHWAAHDQIIDYENLCNDLRSNQFTEWDEVRQRFALVVDPKSLLNHVDRLFVRKSGRREAITIPVSEMVPVGEGVLAIVNTKIFQRLRHTKQLSFCDWFFPGGTHTRFEHSLGVFEMTYRAIKCLVYDKYFRHTHSKEDIDAILLASLLHDIGHYPFSHVLEHYVGSRYSQDKELKEAVSHIANSEYIINSDNDLISEANTYWGSDTLNKAKNILLGKKGILQNLLDGPIDCDKLDYLRRDAHHCGVKFGKGIDDNAILRSLCCIAISGNYQIGVSHTGVPYVEGLMIAQNQMLSSVYWHHSIRSVISMFHRFLDVLFRELSLEDLDKHSSSYRDKIIANRKKMLAIVADLKKCSSDHDAFNTVLLPAVKELSAEDQKSIGPLINLHMEPDFDSIYIAIRVYTQDEEREGFSQLLNIYKHIIQKVGEEASTVPIKWTTVKKLRKCYIESYQQIIGSILDEYAITVDVPWGKGANRMLWAVMEDGNLSPISDVSHLKGTIFSEPTAYTAPIRVFLSPVAYKKCGNEIQTIIHRAEKYFFSEKETSEKLSKLPDKLKFPANIVDKIGFDDSRQLLIFKGVMFNEEKAVLLKLSEDNAYKKAIELLFQGSRTI
jgi:HD superfamily phosphohydrolase